MISVRKALMAVLSLVVASNVATLWLWMRSDFAETVLIMAHPVNLPDYRGQTNFSGVMARTFEWSGPLPCYPAERNWVKTSVQLSPTSTGLLFAKPYKTASSTAVGVHLRIATNLGKKQGQTICQTRFDHALAHKVYPHRNG
jgi:hypothetical protein